MAGTVPAGTDAALRVFSVTDGDTVRIFRRWSVPPSTISLGNGLLLHETRELEDNPEVWRRGLPVRLIHLDTPESRTDKAGWAKARAELIAWLAAREGRLRCIFFEGPESDGAFSRLLADIYTEGDPADSASAWMLLHGNDGRGWPPYVKGV